jgi:hypothetical protein
LARNGHRDKVDIRVYMYTYRENRLPTSNRKFLSIKFSQAQDDNVFVLTVNSKSHVQPSYMTVTL